MFLNSCVLAIRTIIVNTQVGKENEKIESLKNIEASLRSVYF